MAGVKFGSALAMVLAGARTLYCSLRAGEPRSIRMAPLSE
jgi:hypothetical protein